MNNSGLKKNIFLIGFMGSGKSTIGKKIASKINYQFVDMDRAIEEDSKISIPILFKEKGEEFFRQLEHNWLNEFSDNGFVIATGGGTPCFHNNIALMKEKGIVIYLKTKSEILANRLYNANNNRPLLSNFIHDQQSLVNFINQKLNEREHFYLQADYIIEASNFNSSKLEELVELLSANK